MPLRLLITTIFFLWPFTRSQATTYAVVVGIADYQNMTYSNGDLHFADRDAARMAAFLQSKIGGNVPPQHIIQLTNEQATKRAIVQAMQKLFVQANSHDKVLLYFSGHGVTEAFVPYDVILSDFKTLLTHQEVKAIFKISKAQTKICIADACMSGSMKRPHFKTALMTKENTTNVAMMLSSRASQKSVEATRIDGGVFTHFWLKGLNGEADANRNKIVTIRELYVYLSPNIKKYTPHHQAPVFVGKFSNEMILSNL